VFSRSILAIGLTAAALAASASAGDIDTRLALIGGGSLSLTYDPTASSAASLDGRDRTLTYALPLIVNDSRSNGAGWNLTISSTEFDNGAGKTLDPDGALIMSTRVTCMTGDGCTQPQNLIEYPVPMPASASAPAPIKVFNADRDSGMGMFSVVPTVAVSIPGNAYAGNYVGAVAVALISGP
jgi:WxL domain surface cell wall-binding